MNRVLRLLGLGAKARRLVIGVALVRTQLQRGAESLACVVLAADAGPRTQEKVGRLAAARGIPVLRGPAAEQLGAALGRAPVQAVGVSDKALARGLMAGDGGVSGDDTDS